MNLIDRIAHTNRWSRRATAEKLLVCLGGLAVCLAGPPLTTGPLMLLANTLLALFAARLPAKVYFAVLGFPIGFLLAGAPMLLVSVDFSHGLGFGWRADQIGVAAGLVGRAAGAASCLTLLALTTPVHAMIPTLRRIGVPAFLVEIMLLTYRLIFVFAETVARGYNAQTARLGYVGWKRSVNSLGLLAAAFFQRAMSRAQHMEVGLAARGFEGNFPVLRDDGVAASGLRCAAIGAGLSLILILGFVAERFVHV
jgi:cobalt/nickel transport system permease protein